MSAILAFNFSAAAAEPVRIALLPFKINAEKDLSYLRDGIFDMLSTRLARGGQVEVLGRKTVDDAIETMAGAASLNEPAARQIGNSLSADFVLFGSLTVFGSSVSLDAKMIDLSGRKPTLSFFDQSQTMGEVIPRINGIAEEINAKVFGREPVAQPLPATETEAEKPREKTPSIYAHPERLLQEGAQLEGESRGSSSPFIGARSAGETAEFWRSGSFDEQIEGLALGDVDGDGATETVLISSQKIIVLRIQGRRFLKLKEISGEARQKFFWVDVADIKQDGRAEIFVTCINNNSGNLESFVLEWNGTDFETIADRQKWYFRVQEMPDRGRVLLGQKRGVQDIFFPGIYELVWQNGTYESIEGISMPKGATVFDFALGDVMNSGNEMVVTIDSDDRLSIQTTGGKKEWKSDERYGGSESFLLKYPGTSSNQRIFLPQRIFVTDLNRNGKTEVTVVKNDSVSGRFFSNYRRYTNGQFVSLSWDGFGLAENWHTREVSGYFADYAIGDVDNDGQPEIVAAVVSRREGVVTEAKSALIAYELLSLTDEVSKANAPENESQ